jgi:hypothetical protein
MDNRRQVAEADPSTSIASNADCIRLVGSNSIYLQRIGTLYRTRRQHRVDRHLGALRAGHYARWTEAVRVKKR